MAELEAVTSLTRSSSRHYTVYTQMYASVLIRQRTRAMTVYSTAVR